MAQEEMRKGPWTEHEDVQLLLYVKLLGDRRWDFIAKVSGLKRSGKSCRLRWVNYLHPGLKHGKMTPHEERLVIELQSKWGNRWSRIALKLPGRTDNEIKNYWRTHMRKKAQERKRSAMSPTSSNSNISSSSESNNPQGDSMPIVETKERSFYGTGRILAQSSPIPKSSSLSSSNPPVDSMPIVETEERSFYDTGGLEMMVPCGKKDLEEGESEKGYSMDEIWKNIDYFESDTIIGYREDGCNLSFQTMASPIWNYCPDLLWMTEEDEESKMSIPYTPDNCFAYYDQIKSSKLFVG
ncbi:LOW QUALITY PROTEIN: transcription factor MYB48-like [Actinidia eriantha]|uniref:LOW QUALITY PROTEIN: transcription factor MYB48-like n=1 Tax=Actinidia eriantha TaxID=165200 RepID=UPI00258ADCFE|nr:LOW QUALITY PROTEIN: transcription factor MYB48-like [Actinidia eriantha]